MEGFPINNDLITIQSARCFMTGLGPANTPGRKDKPGKMNYSSFEK
jgi:hypothetical protein